MCLSLAAGIILAVANVILGIFGIILTITGILSLVVPSLLHSMIASLEAGDPSLPESTLPNGLLDTSEVFVQSGATLIFFGLAILLVSINGACSSVCGGICRLAYSILTAGFIVGLTVFIVHQTSSAGREELKSNVERALRTKFNLYLERKENAVNGSIAVIESDITEAWFYYQNKMSCCGVKSYEDHNGSVSISCCQQIRPGGVPNDTAAYINVTWCTMKNSTEYLNHQGCLTSAYAVISLQSQLGAMLSSLGVFFLTICLVLSTYLMGS